MSAHAHAAVPSRTIEAMPAEAGGGTIRRDFCACGMHRDTPIGVDVSRDDIDPRWHGALLVLLIDITANRATVARRFSMREAITTAGGASTDSAITYAITRDPTEAVMAFTPRDCPAVGDRIWVTGRPDRRDGVIGWRALAEAGVKTDRETGYLVADAA
jgi:hypothetical protein